MAGLKDDDSTGIEKAVKAFAKDMSTAATDLLKQQEEDKKSGDKAKAKPGKKAAPSKIEFTMDPNAATKSRTPAEQAAEVAAGRSWVCWGAHMADKARHVIMKVDGKISWEPKKVFDDSFNDFKKAWAKAMKDNKLKNAEGKDGWYDGDSFHLELDDSKIDKTDERVAACLEEYVDLTRNKGKKQNDTFEKKYAKDLKPYIDKATKKP